MPITIHEIGSDQFPQYAAIDTSFEVASVLKVVPKANGLAGLGMGIENSEFRIGNWGRRPLQ